MNIIKAPQALPIHRVNGIVPKSIFLAGSIEMGTAEDWQRKVEKTIAEAPNNRIEYIFNPRRDDWNSSWKQELSNPQFYEQVSWEMTALDIAERIVIYFSPETKSPISLLELGLYAKSNKVIVVCPKEFWRSGNVYMVCERYGITRLDNLDSFLRIF